MPIYEYVCPSCHNETECYLLLNEKATIKCELCGGVMVRREIPTKFGPISPRPDDPMEKIKEITDKRAGRSVFGKYGKRESTGDYFGERIHDKIKRGF